MDKISLKKDLESLNEKLLNNEAWEEQLCVNSLLKRYEHVMKVLNEFYLEKNSAYQDLVRSTLEYLLQR